MIKITTRDTLLDIVIKIKESKKENIVLDFPFWHPILHNYLSLKILKNKYSDKSLTIVTNDLTSRKIWKPLWIEYSIIKDKDFFERADFKQNLLKHNFTFSEYLKYITKKYFREFLDVILFNRNINSISRYRKKSDSKSNLWFFLFSLFITVFLFLFIFYFAVNKATVEITPEVDIRIKSKNFIFQEKSNWDDIMWSKYIELRPESKIINIKKKFSATGIDPSSTKKAEWKVIFFNSYPEEFKLKPKTRIETASWIVYESKTLIIIPPSKLSSSGSVIPWEQTIEVIAQTYDNQWRFLWERWNIWKWVKLTVPWLDEEYREKVFAITSTDMDWWSNDYQKIILESDIKNSTDILKNELEIKWLNELRNKIAENNFINKATSFEILWVNDVIKYDNFRILNIEEIVAGKRVDSFELNWTIRVSAYIYDKRKVLDKLKSTIDNSILIWSENMLRIDENSLRISEQIDRSTNPMKIKATVSISYLVSYNFDNNQDSYIGKLKNRIVWLNKNEAIKLLLNDKKVSHVKINIRPFFVKKLPNILDNIIFRVKGN